MSFLAPLSLLFGLLAVPILILYMLKLRRREVEISSTLLWQMLLRDREANAPWQRLRRNLLLLLQLLLLAALVIALARPFFKVPTVATGAVVVLLDASASMNATDVEPNRFEAARAAARQIIEGLAADGSLTLIQVGHQPEVLAPATNDKVELREALARARPTQGAADWEAALALAAGAVRAGDLQESTTVVISDGGLPGESLPPVPGEVRYLPIGSGSDNLALEALALRPTATGPQLFARVANYGDADRTVIVSVYINNELFSGQQLSVPAGNSAEFVQADLPNAPAVYQARLSLPAGAEGEPGQLDSLPLDDSVWAVYQPPAAGRALLVTPGNVFLEQLLAALPGLQPFRASASAPLPTDPFDLYVLDSVITPTIPAANVVMVNPPSNALFGVSGVFTNTAVTRVATDDPLLDHVDWSGVHILKAKRVTVPAWARVLVEAEGGPLVLAGEESGRRVAVLTFDLHDSDLPLLVTYPVLMSNLINYLSPPQAAIAPEGLHIGEALSLNSVTDPGVEVVVPSGTRRPVTVSEAGRIFTETGTPGVYLVASGQTILGAFAVNLFDPAESNIRPAPAIRIGRSDVNASAREEQGQLEIWPWLALAAFVILFLEWWAYHRGSTLPAAPGWPGFFRRKKTTP